MDENWLEVRAPICKTFGALTIPELKVIAAASTSYLVADMIVTPGLGILVGQWGIGKTPLAIQIGIAVAAGGTRFLGRYATSEAPAPVLYGDLENGAFRMSEWAQTIAGFLGLDRVPDQFCVYSAGFCPRHPDHARRGELDYLCAAVRQC